MKLKAKGIFFLHLNEIEQSKINAMDYKKALTCPCLFLLHRRELVFKEVRLGQTADIPF